MQEFHALSSDEQGAFLATVARLVHDLRVQRFRKGLRVKAVRGHPGVFELTSAADGHATFAHGPSVRLGDPHIIWRRVGSHDIFGNP